MIAPPPHILHAVFGIDDVLVMIALTLISTGVSMAIANAAAQSANKVSKDFQGPTATAGNPIPVFWGTALVAPNTVWYGRVQKVKRFQWFYLMSAHHLLGWGVINEIIDVTVSDKSCRNWNTSGAPTYQYQITAIDGTRTVVTVSNFSDPNNHLGAGSWFVNGIFNWLGRDAIILGQAHNVLTLDEALDDEAAVGDFVYLTPIGQNGPPVMQPMTTGVSSSLTPQPARLGVGGIDMSADLYLFGNNAAHVADTSNAMFGGDQQGGGIGADLSNKEDTLEKGAMRVYWGYDDALSQPIDPLLSAPDVYGAQCSRWPNMAYVRMGSTLPQSFYIAAQDGTPKPMRFLCRRTAWWDFDNTGRLSPLGQTAGQATIRTDANPAEILFDLLANQGYGLGRPTAQIDVDSFAACAATLRDEVITDTKVGFGISVTLVSVTNAESVIKDILNVIDASLCTNPLTGKLRLKLIRPDYDATNLPVLDASNTSNVKYVPSTWGETINQVQITYRRFINNTITRGFVRDIAQDQDNANFAATGRIRTLPLDMPYITDADIAALVAARKRRVQSVPLARFSCEMNREGFALMEGDPVSCNESAFDVSNLICRVMTIDYGTLESGKITLELVQDVFTVTAPSRRPIPPGFTPPSTSSIDSSGGGGTVFPPDQPPAAWGSGIRTL